MSLWVWWNHYSEKPLLHSPIPLATSRGQTAGPVRPSLGWMSEAGLDAQMGGHTLKLGTSKTRINRNRVFRSVWKELSLVIKCHNLCYFLLSTHKTGFGLGIHSRYSICYVYIFVFECALPINQMSTITFTVQNQYKHRPKYHCIAIDSSILMWCELSDQK